MNVELTTVVTPDDLSLLHKLYDESFPAEERREWSLIESPATAGCPALFAIIADGHLAGMLTLWNFDRFSYVEHFVIAPDFRGKGVGSEAMRQLIEKIDNRPLVVEIEPAVDSRPETIRRRGFYSQLGFSTISTDYIQPPYTPSLPSVPMHLMATTILPSQSTAATLQHKVYGK
ncbi:MAG: GNAT family N-acetyltransferase [Muribaculaceae bacterium]|nr:GNAT family N-acetyltransferase [Muribaculaceae bacterium]